MNIYYKQRTINESQNIDISPTEFSEINSAGNEDFSNFQELFKKESNFFKFSNGYKMADFNASVDVNNKFSLRWHADHSKDLNDFFESIEKFIKAPLSDSDKTKLTVKYNQLYPEF